MTTPESAETPAFIKDPLPRSSPSKRLDAIKLYRSDLEEIVAFFSDHCESVRLKIGDYNVPKPKRFFELPEPTHKRLEIYGEWRGDNVLPASLTLRADGSFFNSISASDTDPKSVGLHTMLVELVDRLNKYPQWVTWPRRTAIFLVGWGLASAWLLSGNSRTQNVFAIICASMVGTGIVGFVVLQLVWPWRSVYINVHDNYRGKRVRIDRSEWLKFGIAFLSGVAAKVLGDFISSLVRGSP